MNADESEMAKRLRKRFEGYDSATRIAFSRELCEVEGELAAERNTRPKLNKEDQDKLAELLGKFLTRFVVRTVVERMAKRLCCGCGERPMDGPDYQCSSCREAKSS